MHASDADVVIVGAGIAGLSAAYFASRRNRRCLVIDSGLDCASHVPTALINPVRGYRARLSPLDIEGARTTFELIEALRVEGHRLAFGRGLWRPVPETTQRDEWAAILRDRVRHAWESGEKIRSVVRGDWVATLYLPDSGWVETAPLLDALRKASAAKFMQARVARIDVAQNQLMLDDGRTIVGRTLLWCGGARGAAQIGANARFRPGSVLLTRERLSEEALSYGLYCAPHREGSIVGSTTEAQFKHFPSESESLTAYERLIERCQDVFQKPLTPKLRWHGVRLESADLPLGLAHLGRFGSRGYLLAPQAAAAWARRL
ncbi:MAG: FAD-dependent oxidoreductase [Burkholderiaceae bacterium]|jgi:glycine/D-amino acid oxidase-like deaminating enzyme